MGNQKETSHKVATKDTRMKKLQSMKMINLLKKRKKRNTNFVSHSYKRLISRVVMTKHMKRAREMMRKNN